MIRIGQRQFEVPLWLWVAVPLACAIYAAYGATIYQRLATDPRFGNPHEYYFLAVRLGAMGALAGFLVADLARRSVLPWYDLIVPALASFAASSLGIDGLATAVRETPRAVAGLVISIAGSVEPGSVGAALLAAVRIIVPLGCGLILAILVTLASRYLLGLPLRAVDSDMRREFRANLGGAYVWLAIGIGGYAAIRSVWELGPLPRWLPFTAACLGILAASAVQLWLAYRARRDALNPRADLKIRALAAACVFAWFYSPGVYGHAGLRVMNDNLRPALRALRMLPTPAIAVADYRVDVPYHDVEVAKGPAMPDGKTSYVAVPLPDEYGLSSASRNPRVFIVRRDITLREMSRLWFDARKELGEAARSGRDAVVRVPLGVIGGLAFRSDAYPLVDVQLIGFDAAVSTDTAEEALRRFLQERVRRVS